MITITLSTTNTRNQIIVDESTPISEVLTANNCNTAGITVFADGIAVADTTTAIGDVVSDGSTVTVIPMQKAGM